MEAQTPTLGRSGARPAIKGRKTECTSAKFGRSKRGHVPSLVASGTPRDQRTDVLDRRRAQRIAPDEGLADGCGSDDCRCGFTDPGTSRPNSCHVSRPYRSCGTRRDPASQWAESGVGAFFSTDDGKANETHLSMLSALGGQMVSNGSQAVERACGTAGALPIGKNGSREGHLGMPRAS